MEVAQARGEDAGLARSGRGDDPRRARAVGDGGQLVRRQVVVRRDGGRDDGERAGVDRLAVDDGQAVDRAAWPAVDPQRRAVGQHEVGGTVGGGDGALGQTGPP